MAIATEITVLDADIVDVTIIVGYAEEPGCRPGFIIELESADGMAASVELAGEALVATAVAPIAYRGPGFKRAAVEVALAVQHAGVHRDVSRKYGTGG